MQCVIHLDDGLVDFWMDLHETMVGEVNSLGTQHSMCMSCAIL